MLKSLIIFNNKEGKIIFQQVEDSFSKDHLDIVVSFLRAIDVWSNEFSGNGADVFQTENLRITFDKSPEFDLTFAFCTDLSEKLEEDKKKLETIKYMFIHLFWEVFTSGSRNELTDEEKKQFLELLKKI
ncbi:MAG: hypothetical protein ACTSYF_00755 [Promethearchaeota archaeon]